MLGFFSMVSLNRLECLLGDYSAGEWVKWWWWWGQQQKQQQ